MSSVSLSALRKEWVLGVAFATTALFLLFGKTWLADLSNPLWFTLMLVWLFAVIMGSAFAIVHHAESLAVRLGEPLGTLVLTLAVIGIEVMMISAVMLTGESKPALARDAMFGVVMIVLNGMIGVSLLLGGLRHHEQDYNLRGANSFLSLIVSLTVLGMVLPNFTEASPGPTLSAFQSIFMVVMSIAIYGVFLVIQNWRHRDFFIKPAIGEAIAATESNHGETHSLGYHATLLLMYLLPVVVLAEEIALPIDHGIEVLHAPIALGGFLVAALILSPERHPRGAGQRSAAFHQHPPGFGAGVDRVDYSRSVEHRPDHRKDSGPWARPGEFCFAGSYPRGLWAYLHQQSNQCADGRSSPFALSRLPDAAVRALKKRQAFRAW
jgi:Ca2+:H+ antiporter